VRVLLQSKNGTFGKLNIYPSDGHAPTLTATSYKEPDMIMEPTGWQESEQLTKGSDKLKTVNDELFEGKPFNYVSLFSGIGGFEQALNKLGGTCVMASEIDKYANQAYEILYGHPTVGDVTKVAAEDVPDHDLLVGGFPCQAFSVAGKRLGFEEARGTLFFEIARIAKVKQPKAMLLENVKGLISHDSGKTLDTIIQTLDEIGYTVDFEVLNSKYFGVPQNRERIFIIAVRDDLVTPQAWDVGKRSDVVAKGKRRIAQLGVKTFNFNWPSQELVTVRLRDILESDVDEKFYLSEEKTAKLVAQLEAQHPSVTEEIKCYNPRNIEDGTQTRMQDRIYDPEGNTVALTSFCDRLNVIEPQMLGHIDLKGHDAIKRVYSAEGVSPTLTTMGGGHREPKIAVKSVGNVNPSGNGMNGQVYEVESGLSPTLTTNKGEGVKILDEVRPVLTPDRLEKHQNGHRFKEDDEESFTLTAQDKHGVAIGNPPKYRIRKLSPRECFRLQGFPDAEFDKLTANGISNSQLYRQAGNAVTVNVIDAIGKRLVTYLND
jgi:DNA (cytosine-5)-methyltransferase 1